MALSGLRKQDRKEIDKKAEDFIKGAVVRASIPQADAVVQTPKSEKAVFKRVIFSLTQQVSDDIDRLSLVPRTFRTNRSDVVKAGVELLKKLPEEELVQLLETVRQKR